MRDLIIERILELNEKNDLLGNIDNIDMDFLVDQYSNDALLELFEVVVSVDAERELKEYLLKNMKG